MCVTAWLDDKFLVTKDTKLTSTLGDFIDEKVKVKSQHLFGFSLVRLFDGPDDR